MVEDPGVGAAVVGAWDRRASGRAARSSRTDYVAALVEVGRRLDEDLPALASLGRALHDAGGLAVRMERSGHAMDWTTWLSRVEGGDPRGLLALGMILARDADDHLFTCGMHHFDLPEAQMAIAEIEEAAYWLETLSLYLLLESPSLTSVSAARARLPPTS